MRYRGKRPQPADLQETPKRQRYSGLTASILYPAAPVGDLVVTESPVTPKPQKPDLESIKVKMDPDESNTDMLAECGDGGTHQDATEKHLAGTKSVAAVSIQTEVFRVKEEPLRQNEEEGSTEGTKTETERIQKGVTHPIEAVSHVTGGPSTSSPHRNPNMTEAQENQDHLQAVAQAAAQETDSLKEQVQLLTVQLQEAQDRLEGLVESRMEKERCHQFNQTEDGTDYKHLFGKLKEKIEALIKASTLSLTTTDAEPSAVQRDEKDIHEIAQPVEFLIKELEQRDKERDELRSQVCQSVAIFLSLILSAFDIFTV